MGRLLQADRIAVVGDAHGKLGRADVRYFDDADYDLVLFVGDLGSGSRSDGLSIIRELARMETPALVLAGNNDALHLASLDAELAYQHGQADLQRLMGVSMPVGVRPCGYSLHPLVTASGPLTLLAARPCSMGGPELHFPEQLDRAYGIRTMTQSTERLCELVREIETESVLVLAHNGPFGLGEDPSDPFGRDFGPPNSSGLPGDWGDPDLAAALQLCQQLGKKVVGVLAGHMHRGPDAGDRPFVSLLNGVPVFNTALVPRVRYTEEGAQHHHVELVVTPELLQARERWVLLPPS